MKRLILLLAAGMCLAATPAPQKITVNLIGDSTMADKPLDHQNPERGWGQYLPSLFDEGVVVRNFAKNGRSTKSVINNGEWAAAVSQMQAGEYLFIQYGHNDSHRADTTRYAEAWGEYTDNLTMMVRTAKQMGVIPVLLTPIERRYFTDNGAVREGIHGDYPAAMWAVAERERVLLIDMTELTYDWLGKLGDEASRSYFMNIAAGVNPKYPDGRVDNTHLVARGASAVARIAAAQIRELIPALASHLRDGYDFFVAQDGSGDFMTVQEAIDAVPDFIPSGRVRIFIKAGVYREHIIVPASKRNLSLVGEDAATTTITYDNYADRVGSTGVALGTAGSATFYLFAEDFTAENITFENSAGQVGQAVALCVAGDRAAFLNCRIIGNQDTLFTYGRGMRQYYDNCYIEGTTDFIFGYSVALFENCTIYSKKNSYITAAATPEGQQFGYVFINCKLTAAEGVDKVYLGRPWRNYARTVYINCEMGAHIRPEGWHNWSKPEAERTVFYAEYGSVGLGASPATRVEWSHQMTAQQAAVYAPLVVLAGWQPR